MPSKKESLMVQAVFAFAQGCGSVGIDDAASEWFHDRYFPWIDHKKKSTGKSPQDVWAIHGKDFVGKFQAIGKMAASGGKTIDQTTLEKSATSVEQDSDCPYCPIKE
jgi:hypothetical protein